MATNANILAGLTYLKRWINTLTQRNIRSLDTFGPLGTNQTALLQQAITWANNRGGGTIYLPFRPGGYSITPGQIMLCSNLTLLGDPNTRIVSTIPLTSLPGDSVKIFTGTGLENIQFRNLTFQSNHYLVRGIHLQESRNVQLDSIQTDQATLITFKDSDGLTLTRITGQGILAQLAGGIFTETITYINTVSSVNITGKTIRIDSYGHGFQWFGGDAAVDPTVPGQYNLLTNVRKSKNILVEDIRVTNVAGGGIWGSMGENITVRNFYVEKCGDVGIDFEGCINAVAERGTAKDCHNGNFTTFYYCRGIKFRNVTSILTSNNAGKHTGTYGQVNLTTGCEDLEFSDFTAITESLSNGLAKVRPDGASFQTVSFTGTTTLINTGLEWNTVPTHLQSIDNLVLRLTKPISNQVSLVELGSCLSINNQQPRLTIGSMQLLSIPQPFRVLGLTIRMLNQTVQPMVTSIDTLITEGCEIDLITKNEVVTTDATKRSQVLIKSGKLAGGTWSPEGDPASGVYNFRRLLGPGGPITGDSKDFLESRQYTALVAKPSSNDLGSGFINITEGTGTPGLYPGAGGLQLFTRIKHPNPTNDFSLLLGGSPEGNQLWFGKSRFGATDWYKVLLDGDVSLGGLVNQTDLNRRLSPSARVGIGLGNNFTADTWFALGTIPGPGLDAPSNAVLFHLDVYQMRDTDADLARVDHYQLATRREASIGDNIRYTKLGNDTTALRPAVLELYEQPNGDYGLYLHVKPGENIVGVSIPSALNITVPASFTPVTTVPAGTLLYTSRTAEPQADQPIASSSTLGLVKIGANINVATDGTISVAPPGTGSGGGAANTDQLPEGTTNLYLTPTRVVAAAPVKTVAGKTGNVTLTGGDVGLGNVTNVNSTLRANHTGTQPANTITGLAAVATSGSYNDLSNRPVLSGSNTGDETNSTIKSKLGISVLSGANTGDQTLSLSGNTLSISGSNGNSVILPSSGGGGGSSTGDMLRSTYDTNSNGVVDNSERLGGQLPGYYVAQTGSSDIQITDPSKGLILAGGDGSLWRITVDPFNNGALVTTRIN